MKRTFIIAALVVAFILAGSAVLAQQQGYGQEYGPQGQGWFCPWCGQQHGQGMGSGMMHRGQGMGPGMMNRGQGMPYGWQGQGMGPGMMPGWQGQGMRPGMQHGYRGQGMMHGGRGMGPGMRGDQWGRGQYGPSGQPQQMEPLSKNEARNLAEDYVARNPNLKIGDLSEMDEVYEARVETKDGSLVERLLIDKQTGWMKKAY